jgi:Ca2+-binding EF-hand superfamily protein
LSPICPSNIKPISPNRTNRTTYYSPSRVSPQNEYFTYEERQFNDFLIKLMNIEDQIESAKINLALNPDFNCEDAFRIFELNGRGFLDENDLKYGLNLIGVYPTDFQVRLLMKRFDLQKEGCINYVDFFDMLVPFEKEYRTMVENRLPRSCCLYRCPDVFCFNTLCALRNVFNLIINTESEINNNRKLFGTLRLRLRDIFGLLDYLRTGYFTNSDLIVYLKNRGLFTTNKQADLLFIRLDKYRNGKIDFRNVEDELQTLY